MTWWRGLWFDLRLATRQARRRPAFSLTCIGALALGLGTATAIFSLLYSTVLKPLPYPDPDRLVAVHNRYPQAHLPRVGVSPIDYLDLRAHRELFAETGAYYFLDLSRTSVEVPEKVNAVAITASLFRTLGVAPLMGRNFNDAEERYQGPGAVILSEGYWQREFARDSGILGKALYLNGELYRITGVMPASFRYPNDVTEMWTPIQFSPAALNRSARRANYLRMFARLAPDLDFEQAAARIDQLSRRISIESPEDHPYDRSGWRFFLLPMARDDDGSLRRWLYLLFLGGVGLWLIVCSNVAGLLLVRATERQFELSLRMALGASRWRIARQVLAEILVLSMAGGLLGLGIADAGVKALGKFGPWGEAGIDPPVFAFLFALSLLTGLLCGLYPLRAGVKANREGGHQRTASRRQHRLRQALIAGQVALATTLLGCGGLLTRSLLRLIDTPPGFDPRGVLTLQISLPPKHYVTPESRARFYREMLDQVRRLPGVEAATGCTNLPFGWGENINTFEIVGRPKPQPAPFANLDIVEPDYLRAMRIPLLAGRFLDDRDGPAAEPAIVIDQTIAQEYFSGVNPVGQQVRMPWDRPFTIVGVVGGVKSAGLDAAIRPKLYFSGLQYPGTDRAVVIRSGVAEGALKNAVQRIVTGLDKDQPIHDVLPLETRVAKTLRTRRMVAGLAGLFAGSGILLAAIGLYGVLSYSIALRRREIGIRVVLGADRWSVSWLMARGGILVGLAGLALGGAGVLIAHRVAAPLRDAQVGDALTWLVVLSVVGVSCLAACALPAWRAGRMEPMDALRAE